MFTNFFLFSLNLRLGDRKSVVNDGAIFQTRQVKRFELALFVALVVGAAILFLQKPLWHQDQIAKTETVNLATDPRADAIYQLSPADQHLLVHAVEHFCVQEYHRDTCIHHLITCGTPCLVVIPKPQRAKIFADYQGLRQSRGLPPITPIVRGDEDP